ncbi:MAG TPA: galactosyltransferase-related protein [Polyangiaceae bacterium]
MGRLRFVQRTLPRAIEDPDIRYCLVDYSCPEGISDWVNKHYEFEVQQNRVLVERVTGQKVFNKSRAHNIGARRALDAGVEYLCFMDADTLIEPGFWDFVRAQLRPERFLVAAPQDDGTPMPSLTGLLIVHGAAFERTGGFDEAFTGWGAEDIELRLRLYLEEGLDFAEIPLSLVRPIPHSNSLRARFHEDRNIERSNRRNLARIVHKLRTEWACRLERNPASAQELVFPGTELHDALGACSPLALARSQEDRPT